MLVFRRSSSLSHMADISGDVNHMLYFVLGNLALFNYLYHGFGKFIFHCFHCDSLLKNRSFLQFSKKFVSFYATLWEQKTDCLSSLKMVGLYICRISNE